MNKRYLGEGDKNQTKQEAVMMVGQTSKLKTLKQLKIPN
jgi:hypothetical protein